MKNLEVLAFYVFAYSSSEVLDSPPREALHEMKEYFSFPSRDLVESFLRFLKDRGDATPGIERNLDTFLDLPEFFMMCHGCFLKEKKTEKGTQYVYKRPSRDSFVLRYHATVRDTLEEILEFVNSDLEDVLKVTISEDMLCVRIPIRVSRLRVSLDNVSPVFHEIWAEFAEFLAMNSMPGDQHFLFQAVAKSATELDVGSISFVDSVKQDSSEMEGLFAKRIAVNAKIIEYLARFRPDVLRTMRSKLSEKSATSTYPPIGNLCYQYFCPEQDLPSEEAPCYEEIEDVSAYLQKLAKVRDAAKKIDDERQLQFFGWELSQCGDE